MAIYSNGKAETVKKYGVARSSKIKESNHIYDLIDESNAVEQGSIVKVGKHTGNGLQERVCLTATTKDKVVFVCDVPLIHRDFTASDQLEYKYINVAGKNFRAYEIAKDDVIGVSDYMFTTVANELEPTKVGNYVVTDGNRKYIEKDSAPDASQYGFIGEIIGYEKYQYDTIVLINVIQNIDITE